MDYFIIIVILVYLYHFLKLKEIVDRSKSIVWIIIGEISYLLGIILIMCFRYIDPIISLLLLILIGAISGLSIYLKFHNYHYDSHIAKNRDNIMLKFGTVGVLILILVLLVHFLL